MDLSYLADCLVLCAAVPSVAVVVCATFLYRAAVHAVDRRCEIEYARLHLMEQDIEVRRRKVVIDQQWLDYERGVVDLDDDEPWDDRN